MTRSLSRQLPLGHWLNEDLQFSQLSPHGQKIAAVPTAIMNMIKARRSKELHWLSLLTKNRRAFSEPPCRFCFLLAGTTSRGPSSCQRGWKSKYLAVQPRQWGAARKRKWKQDWLMHSVRHRIGATTAVELAAEMVFLTANLGQLISDLP